MFQSIQSTALYRCNDTFPNQVDSDVLVVLVPKQACEQISALFPPATAQSVETMLKRELFQGRKGEHIWFPVHDWGNCELIMLIGVGDAENLHDWRQSAATAARKAKQLKAKVVGLHPLLSDTMGNLTSDQAKPILDQTAVAYALVEGFWLGAYQRKSYAIDKLKASTEEKTQDVKELQLWLAQGFDPDLNKMVQKAEVYAAATNYARALTNLPGNRLTPERLADEAMQLAKEDQFSCEVLTEDDIALLGIGGLQAVGGGSAHPPRLITLRYMGNPDSSEVIGLVGKGITFDTGGISLKRAQGMEEMVSDMGGAAAVLGVFKSLGLLRPQINVIGVIPAAENMPSGTAYRPGDIITTLSGKTVEVLNTDAEGRIVLADAITYAKRQGATRLIDISTLTGAALVALGDTATAAVTNDDTFLQRLLSASEATGELIWQLPAFEEYKEMIKSEVADVKNSAGRNAASITAGLFIGTFAEETPWIHLDIAGTAWLTKAKAIDPKGGTGVMVRTLIELLDSYHS